MVTIGIIKEIIIADCKESTATTWFLAPKKYIEIRYIDSVAFEGFA